MGVLVVGKELREVVAEDRGAARLEPHDGHTGDHVVAEHVDGLAERALGGGQHPQRDHRQPAADPALGERHVEAGILEHLDRRCGRPRPEVVGEGIGEEESPSPS